MFEATVGTLAHEFVFFESIQQAVALPKVSAQSQFASHGFQNLIVRRAEAGIDREQPCERLPAAETHLEASVVQSQKERLHRARRGEHREQPGNAAAHGEVLAAVEHGVYELAGDSGAGVAQGSLGVFGDRVPGQQWNDMRSERRLQWGLLESFADPPGSPERSSAIRPRTGSRGAEGFSSRASARREA